MAPRFLTSTDGTRLAVFESGNPEGPVIVAVHGYPDHHSVWDGVAAGLGDRFRVVTYDVRGAGESGTPAATSAYRIDRLGDDLATVIDAVSPGAPVHVLGHDWGSIQLWDPLAQPRFADRVTSFVSISGASLDFAGVWLRDPRHLRASLRQLLASWYMLAFQVPWLPELAVRRGAADRVLGKDPSRSERDTLHGIRLYRANAHRVFRPRPRRLDLPVLVISPVDDPYSRHPVSTQSPVPFVTDLAVEAIPGRHWAVRDDPDRIADLISGFLDRVSAPNRPDSAERAAHRARIDG